MEAIARREALRGLAMVVAFSLLHRPALAQTSPSTSFTPPTGPMHFSRTLVRSLSDGKAIVVTRVWEVRFEPLGAGYVLNGTQSSVSVEGPEALKPLLDLEKGRVDTSLFPIMLTRDGLIMSENGATSQRTVDRAIAIAEKRIGASSLPDVHRVPVRSFLRTLQNSVEKAANRLPRDLFAPKQASRTEQRSMKLAGNLEGEITIKFEADFAETSGILLNAERVVTTRVGETSQVSTELWVLAEIGPA